MLVLLGRVSLPPPHRPRAEKDGREEGHPATPPKRRMGRWGQGKHNPLPSSLPQRSVTRSASMAAVWHPISASVCRTGGVTTVPVVSSR